RTAAGLGRGAQRRWSPGPVVSRRYLAAIRSQDPQNSAEFYHPGMHRILRPGTVWALMPLGCSFGTLASNPITGDTWWTITTGRLVFETGRLPDFYPFTFAPESVAFVDAQWLAQVVYYLPYPLLGLGGVAALNALIVTATFA